MILFNLKCAKEHVFEGWFRNGDACEEQVAGKAVACPVCGSRKIEKAPMAPRIAKGGGRDASEGASVPEGPAAEKAAELMQALRALRSKVEAEGDFVGDRFAEEARRIHYGEVETRSIYGQTSDEEAAALHEEGVPFSRIPWVPRHDS
jgi:hypothetical protein